MSTLSPAIGAGKPNYVGSMLDWALSYAARGWRVVPLHSPVGLYCSCQTNCKNDRGKHPRISDGSKGASSDAEKIRRWWSKWPDANIGLATGPGSGLIGLDVDGSIGQHSLSRFEHLPKTLMALSGRVEGAERAGFHHYFRWPENGTTSNSKGRVGKNIDVRGLNGYLVAPPSLHASGHRYEWINEGESIANAPAWLLTAASQPGDVALAAGETGMFFGLARHPALLNMAGTWRRQGDEPDTILDKLRTMNARRCRPPCQDSKLIGFAKSSKGWAVGGPNPLQIAAKKLASENHAITWTKFLSLLWHLSEGQPGLPILLPLVEVGKVVGCDSKLISVHRGRAVRLGILQEIEKYNHLAGKATLFKVLASRPKHIREL